MDETTDAPVTVGSILAHLRQEHGLTQRAVEARSGLPHGLLGHMETGKRPPTLPVVISVARALELSDGHTQVLLGLTIQERFQDDVALFEAHLEGLPTLGYTLHLGTSAAAGFLRGWRDTDVVSALSGLLREKCWTLKLQDPNGKVRVEWEIPAAATRGSTRNAR